MCLDSKNKRFSRDLFVMTVRCLAHLSLALFSLHIDLLLPAFIDHTYGTDTSTTRQGSTLYLDTSVHPARGLLFLLSQHEESVGPPGIIRHQPCCRDVSLLSTSSGYSFRTFRIRWLHHFLVRVVVVQPLKDQVPRLSSARRVLAEHHQSRIQIRRTIQEEPVHRDQEDLLESRPLDQRLAL